MEATSVKVVLAATRLEKSTKSMLGHTARVYPATDQHRTRSDSREKASSSQEVTDQHRTRLECDAAVKEERGERRSEWWTSPPPLYRGEASGGQVHRRYTAKHRKAYNSDHYDERTPYERDVDVNERDADEDERGQKAYAVSRLKDGKIMIATYAQTHNYVYILMAMIVLRSRMVSMAM